MRFMPRFLKMSVAAASSLTIVAAMTAGGAQSLNDGRRCDVQIAPYRAVRGPFVLEGRGTVTSIRRTLGSESIDALPLVELSGPGPIEGRSFRLKLTCNARLPFRVGDAIEVTIRAEYGIERSRVNAIVRDASGALLLARADGADLPDWTVRRGREISFRANRGGEHLYGVTLAWLDQVIEATPMRWTRFVARDATWLVTGSEQVYDRPNLTSPSGRGYVVLRVR